MYSNMCTCFLDFFLIQLLNTLHKHVFNLNTKPSFHSHSFLVSEVPSFVELAKLLLSSGVKYFLSEKLNQDPLEEYFSKQRAAGGSWDNPTVEQFGHNMLSLYVASTSAKASKKGNVRKRNRPEDIVLDNTPLPKRK